jgi:hypothetical protein
VDGEVRERNDETKYKYKQIHMRSKDDECACVLQYKDQFLLVDMLTAQWDGMHRIRMGRYKLFSSMDQALMVARLTG